MHILTAPVAVTHAGNRFGKMDRTIAPAILMAYTELVACKYCDKLHRKVRLPRRSVARCTRCHAILYQHTDGRVDKLLAVALTAFIAFLIANGFPIVELEAQGISTQTTLVGAVYQLWDDGRWIIALMVLCCTLLFPIFETLALLYLLIPLQFRRRPRYFDPVLRALLAVRPWGMIEVFMLGVLVTLMKLSSLARLMPEPALFAFGALTALTALTLSFDPHTLWDVADARCGRWRRSRRRLNALRAADTAMAQSMLPPPSP
ncbi:paraquat-inducible protein A [Robbsia andropogonis]|uniref:paraquat-inducible protein A n=3 Tax=Robbsia andropogonis TaxID=28092 RepID=UPI000AB06C06|nr:paraquat-inducible protein A [Robbsia andropogonis]MCP1118355.1 paraquat-inducible protein A [Robbsia andropogonis]MCP1127866.1 paraquat-inducible protein A [Robbsia andropogonis]